MAQDFFQQRPAVTPTIYLMLMAFAMPDLI